MLGVLKKGTRSRSFNTWFRCTECLWSPRWELLIGDIDERERGRSSLTGKMIFKVLGF